MCSIAPYVYSDNSRRHMINRRAQKKSSPVLGELFIRLFTLLGSLRRTACGLVPAIAAAARALGRVGIRSGLRPFALGLLCGLLIALRLALGILARGARFCIARALFPAGFRGFFRLFGGSLRGLIALLPCVRRTVGSLSAASSSAAATALTGGLVVRVGSYRLLRRQGNIPSA